MNSIRALLTRRLIVTLAGLLGVGLLAIYVTVWFVLAQSFDAALGRLSARLSGQAAAELF